MALINSAVAHKIYLELAVDAGDECDLDAQWFALLPKIHAAFVSLPQAVVDVAETTIAAMNDDMFSEYCCGDQETLLCAEVSDYIQIVAEIGDYC